MFNQIHVLGWYGHNNIGDESYKIVFPKLFPEYQFVFCDTLKGLDTEILILGGGNVIHPTFLKQVKNSKAKKKYALSVDMVPDLDQHLFDKIIPRNECYPDFAFALESDKERGRTLIRNLFDQHKCELYENVVVVVMNSFLATGDSTLARDYINFEKVCLELSQLMDQTSASFILLPFGNGFPHNDRIANGYIYSKCKYWKKNIMVFDTLSVQDTLDIFAGADASINTRLHSNIFSCIGGIPFIDLCHHNKTKLFMQYVSKLHWQFDYWHLHFTNVKILLDKFLKDKELYKDEIQKINLNCKRHLEQLKIDFNI